MTASSQTPIIAHGSKLGAPLADRKNLCRAASGRWQLVANPGRSGMYIGNNCLDGTAFEPITWGLIISR